MTIQPVTLNLPKSFYNQILRRAEISFRTVEEELLDVVASAIPITEELSDSLATAVQDLELLDDESLWRAARSRMPSESSQEMERFHFKREREGISEEEKQVLSGLVYQYGRTMLVRAKAAAILNNRGHDHWY